MKAFGGLPLCVLHVSCPCKISVNLIYLSKQLNTQTEGAMITFKTHFHSLSKVEEMQYSRIDLAPGFTWTGRMITVKDPPLR